MSSRKNNLRKLRERSRLSQAEFAFLLSSERASVSRLELETQPPSIYVVFACEVLFGESGRSLFPESYTAVENQVIARARTLARELKESPRKSIRLEHTKKFLAELFRDQLAREQATVCQNQKDTPLS